MAQLTGDDVLRAAERIRDHVHRTPILTCHSLDAMAGATLHFKCENFQRVGAFKFRGASNAVLALKEEEAARGVLTHSSGNHAAALALAARIRGIPATVVMPRDTLAIKQEAVAGYGARTVHCEPTLKARETTAAAVQEETGATLIHSYDNAQVIAGQGTAALELLEAVPDLDLVMTPVGGGGLLSGTLLAVTARSPQTVVIAAEPAGADDAYRSLKAGRLIPQTDPQTIADGLRTSLSALTFGIIRTHVADIVTVSEASIVSAMRHVWERMKIIIEPSSAVPVAALLNGQVAAGGKRVGIILSGGNVDLDHLPWLSKGERP